MKSKELSNKKKQETFEIFDIFIFIETHGIGEIHFSAEILFVHYLQFPAFIFSCPVEVCPNDKILESCRHDLSKNYRNAVSLTRAIEYSWLNNCQRNVIVIRSNMKLYLCIKVHIN